VYEQSGERAIVDSSVPNPARVWDYFLGGKDSFAADRDLAERVMEVLPNAPLIARLTRQFLVTVVRDLTASHGIRQFLDIGSGLPTADNTHQVAQRVDPSCRIVYADNDPVVIAHANALLVSTSEGACDYLRADVRDVDTILDGATRTLDFTQPIAVLMLQLLHFVSEEDDPYSIVRRIMDAMPSGSYLVLAHGCSDVYLDVAQELTAMSRASAIPLRLRSRPEVARFFDGLELTGPGLVSGLEWLEQEPAAGGIHPAGITYGYSAVARKP
jgi:hypothetical protein